MSQKERGEPPAKRNCKEMGLGKWSRKRERDSPEKQNQRQVLSPQCLPCYLPWYLPAMVGEASAATYLHHCLVYTVLFVSESGCKSLRTGTVIFFLWWLSTMHPPFSQKRLKDYITFGLRRRLQVWVVSIWLHLHGRKCGEDGTDDRDRNMGFSCGVQGPFQLQKATTDFLTSCS